MEQHIIPLNKGVHLTPSVGEEGQLIDCVNLIPKNGSLQNAPVLKDKGVTLNTDHILQYIHRPNVSTTNILTSLSTTSSGHTTVSIWLNPIAQGDEAILTLNQDVTLDKIESAGNTVVVFASDGMHYLLWKDGSYKNLGTHLPEIAMRFKCQGGTVTASNINAGYFHFTNLKIDESYIKGVTDAIHGAINKLIAEEVTEKGMFAHPFFVRYAFRLYDGSTTMPSAPILIKSIVVGADNTFDFEITNPVCQYGAVEDDGTGSGNSGAGARYEVSAKRGSLVCTLTDSEQESLQQWEDIISSIDVFVSAPLYLYDQDKNITDLITDSVGGLARATLTLPDYNNERLMDEIKYNGTFYLVHSIKIEDISDGGVVPDLSRKLDALVNREQLKDDYDSHDTLLPKYSFVYNQRLNIANIDKQIFGGFTPKQLNMFPLANGDKLAIAVTYSINGKTIVTRQENDDISIPDLFYYYNPNANAQSISMVKQVGSDVSYRTIKLTQHNLLQGSYAIVDNNDWTVYAGSYEDACAAKLPTPTSDNTIPQPNKIYTSEINNPFFFPLSGINTVGVGEIRGICSAVKSLSQGQFGQFPLYVFSTDGIWAMEVNSDGTYSVKQPVTRDVCNNPNSITQLDNAVLYATERGLNVIAGSETRLLTPQLEGATEPLKPIKDDYESITGLTFPYSTATNLLAVLGNEGTKISYDGINNIAHIYPSDNNVGHWMLNLDTMEWTRSSDNSPVAFVDGYPNATIQRNEEVTENNVTTTVSKLYEYQRTDISEPHTLRNGFLLTRETALDNPTAMKVLHDLKTMCRFHNYTTSSGTPPVVTIHNDNSVKVIPYVSNDRTKWYRLNSLKGHSWKWYRFALFTNLTDVDTLEGIVLISDLRRTDKLR